MTFLHSHDEVLQNLLRYHQCAVPMQWLPYRAPKLVIRKLMCIYLASMIKHPVHSSVIITSIFLFFYSSAFLSYSYRPSPNLDYNMVPPRNFNTPPMTHSNNMVHGLQDSLLRDLAHPTSPPIFPDYSHILGIPPPVSSNSKSLKIYFLFIFVCTLIACNVLAHY